MPFKSKAQRRLFYAKADRGEIPMSTVKEWERHTEDKDLPEKKASAVYKLGFELGKQARDMPGFTEQDRPKKVKKIYEKLKEEHPEYPAATKARIAARKGAKSKEKRKEGPPYKSKLTGYGS